MTTMTNTHSATQHGQPRRRLSLLGMMAVARQRRALARLNASQLSDIGLSRPQAEAEARRPIWDAPSVWICKP